AKNPPPEPGSPWPVEKTASCPAKPAGARSSTARSRRYSRGYSVMVLVTVTPPRSARKTADRPSLRITWYGASAGIASTPAPVRRRGLGLGLRSRGRRRCRPGLGLEDEAPDQGDAHAERDGQKEALIRIFHRVARSAKADPATRARGGGTGSGPPAFHGWQRSKRRTASHVPRMGPCATIASAA